MKKKIALLKESVLRTLRNTFSDPRLSDPIEGRAIYCPSNPRWWVFGDCRDTKIIGYVYVYIYKSGRRIAYITDLKSTDTRDTRTPSSVNMTSRSFRTEQEFQAFCEENELMLFARLLPLLKKPIPTQFFQAKN